MGGRSGEPRASGLLRCPEMPTPEARPRFQLKSGQAMGHRGYPCGHALSPAHKMLVFLRPDTRDLGPVATVTPVDPVVLMSHCLSRSQDSRI